MKFTLLIFLTAFYQITNTGNPNLNPSVLTQIEDLLVEDSQQKKDESNNVRIDSDQLNTKEQGFRISSNDTLIINKYTPVLDYDICLNQIIVEDASEFKIGDTVIMMQMKGAVIDSSNTSSFGTVTDYKSAGNYEYNYISSITGDVVGLKNVLLKTYEIPEGVVQLIRVPYYQNLTTTEILTAKPWDGKTGGVLAFNVAQTLTLDADIDVSGKGFRGGRSINQFNTSLTCFKTNYSYPKGTIDAAEKGESIYNIGNQNSYGRGKNATGGGGGNGHNSGGGGGGNFGMGGFGGYQLLPCDNTPFDNRGVGGISLNYLNTVNKIFLGGGGGSGHVDNANGIDMKGGDGGGIIIVSAGNLITNGYKILNNGDEAQKCNNAVNNCHDAGGGGGGGGTTLLSINSYTNNLVASVVGGRGADLVIYNSASGADKIGTGGGGAGGLVWIKSATIPANLNTQLNGGSNGVIVQNNNDAWGATPGSNGGTFFNLQLPIASTPFKPNIDSVRITKSNICNSFNFNGLTYTNANSITSWQWFFGNAGTAATQNASFNFINPGTYDVKLIATDANGCKDSFAIPISTVVPPQQPITTLAQPTCTTTTGSITITAPLGSNLEYSINGTSFQNSPLFTGLAVNSYNVIVRDKVNGCVSPVSSVSIDPATGTPPTPQAAVTDQPDCTTTTGTITVTSPTGAFYDYSIDGVQFQAGTVFNGLSPGNYSLIVRNNLSGCTATSTAITVDPVPANPAAPVIGNILQPGCSVSTGSFTIASPLGPYLLYSLNGNNPQASTNFTGLTPGTYTITAGNSSNGCISASSNVVINPEPVIPSIATASVTEQPSCTISSGTITITAPIGTNYEYSVDGSLFQSSLIFQNLLPNNYNVVVRDKISGCSSQPLPLIIQPDISATGSYFMANAFTPNGDGLNDCFGIKNWGVITELQFLIYNRWGELVFSTTNHTACWDGNFKGQPSPLGNYVYYVKATTLCGKIERKGNLALIR